MSRNDDELIADILAAIRRVEEIVAEGREAFDGSHVLQAAAVFNIQVIGEAASHLSEPARSAHSDVPWRRVIGMRNFVVHRYFDVDPEVVWDTATRAIPQLRRDLG